MKNKGLDLLNKRKWYSAIELFDQFQQKQQYQNNIEELQFLKSIALQELNYIEEANEITNQLLKLQPKFHDDLFQVYQHCNDQIGSAIQCYCYKQKGDLNKILEISNILSKQDQQYPPILNFKGKNIDSKFYQAQTLCDLNRFNESKQTFDLFISQFPNSFNAYFGKGQLCEKLEKYEESIYCYEKASKISPLYKQSYYNKCRLLEKLQRYHESIYIYDLLFQIDKSDYQIYIGKGQALLEANDYQTAIFYFNFILEKQPKNYNIHLKKCHALIGLKQYSEASLIIDELASKEQKNVDVLYQKGWLLFQQQDYHTTIKICDQILILNSKFFQAHLLKGKAQLYLIKNFSETYGVYFLEAMHQFDCVIQQQPQIIEAYLNKCKLLILVQNYEEALLELNSALVYSSDNLLILTCKGKMLHKLNYYEEGLEISDLIICLYPNSGVGYLIKAICLTHQLKFNDAFLYGKKFLNLSCIDAKSCFDYGNFLNNVDECQSALNFYNKAIELKSNYFKAQYFKSRTLRKIGQFQESYDLLRSLLQQRPNSSTLYFESALTLQLMGKFDEALQMQFQGAEIESQAKSFQQWKKNGQFALKGKDSLQYQK